MLYYTIPLCRIPFTTSQSLGGKKLAAVITGALRPAVYKFCSFSKYNSRLEQRPFVRSLGNPFNWLTESAEYREAVGW